MFANLFANLFREPEPLPEPRPARTISFLEQRWGHALHMVARSSGKRPGFTAMCHCTPGPNVGDQIEFWWTHPQAKLTPAEIARGRQPGEVAVGVFTMVEPCGDPKDMYAIQFTVDFTTREASDQR